MTVISNLILNIGQLIVISFVGILFYFFLEKPVCKITLRILSIHPFIRWHAKFCSFKCMLWTMQRFTQSTLNALTRRGGGRRLFNFPNGGIFRFFLDFWNFVQRRNFLILLFIFILFFSVI
ncbi:MAG: hypothetical protein B7C55_10905 [Actinomycetales bacterium mxb001]|nr:MAG: hypothetical protein B7C55_10905 [Actinomycetales bacterium mxb001]